MTSGESPMVAAPRPAEAYNYAHFRTKHFVADLAHSLRGEGIAPGAEAPDFDLPDTTGERVRLSDLRGRPVVIHTGSPT